MKKQMAEDAYIKCDILTGRLYRCLTGLLQDFLDIQLTSVYGDRWMDQVLRMAESLRYESSSKGLLALLDKKARMGAELMDKTSIDVTIANTLILYNLYYITSVPTYELGKKDMVDLLAEASDKPKTRYESMNDRQLERELFEQIRRDILVANRCQAKMHEQVGPQKKQLTNGKIRNQTFYKLVDKLVKDKNALNSHMSEVDDPTSSDILIGTTIKDLRNLLQYLEMKWEYPKKDEFVRGFNRRLDGIERLRYSNDFGDVVDALNRILETDGAKKTGRTEAGADRETGSDRQERGRDEDDRDSSRQPGTGKKKPAVPEPETEPETVSCAYVMLAMMYRTDWGETFKMDRLLNEAAALSDPGAWRQLARKHEKDNLSLAVAYYLGYGMIYYDNEAKKMAEKAARDLSDLQILSECFRIAGALDEKVRQCDTLCRSIESEREFMEKKDIFYEILMGDDGYSPYRA